MIKTGRELGLKNHFKHILIACPICTKRHWVRLINNKPKNLNCITCTAKQNVKAFKGNKNGKWNGGRWKTDKGYIMIFIDESSFFAPMRQKNNHTYEHRLVMAQFLGRCLAGWEHVHHKNHIRDDNRIENLKLFKKSVHQSLTILEEANKRLRNTIKELQNESKKRGKQNDNK